MEKVYLRIIKVIMICIVTSFLFFIIRPIMIDVFSNIGSHYDYEKIVENANEDGEIDDVEGYGILFGFLIASMGLTMAILIGIMVIGFSFIFCIGFVISAILLLIAKALDKNGCKTWRKVLSTILFIIYFIIHLGIILFSSIYVSLKLLPIDFAIYIVTLAINTYLYIKGRIDSAKENKEEASEKIVVEELDDSKIKKIES